MGIIRPSGMGPRSSLGTRPARTAVITSARRLMVGGRAYIDEVIQRRRGLPILLSIVTIEVAARVGLHLDPIGFPGHFLVSPREGEPRFYVDPFHAGAILRQDDLRARLTIGMAGRFPGGATLDEFARTLKAHDAGRVTNWVAARTLRN